MNMRQVTVRGLVLWTFLLGAFLPGGTKADDQQEPVDKVKALPIPKEITVQIGEKVSMKLALIPAGKFMMGSPDAEKGRSSDEGPQHEVTISKAFYMGIHEVTQEQYEAIMGKNPSRFKGATNPVENVSWDDAVEFCNKLSQKTGKTVRLPTEAQWEYSCRAGTKTRFCFGDDDTDLRDHAWYKGNYDEGKPPTHPVGQKKPNPWGLYDMHGNVEEWCSDYYADSYAKAKNAAPEGPASGSDRVLRGGGFGRDPQNCRSAYRYLHSPGTRSYEFGFRVSVDVK